MKRLLLVLAVLLASSAAFAARVWIRRERLELTSARATAFNGVVVGQLPACTNWRSGSFQKECSRSGQLHAPLRDGSCPGGWTPVTALYVECRYTPATIGDVPDGVQLETE